MKREHFEHVVERFNLETNWDDTAYNDIEVVSLYVESQKDYTTHATKRLCWWICNNQHYVFEDIDTKDEAEQILKYLNATELLFV